MGCGFLEVVSCACVKCFYVSVCVFAHERKSHCWLTLSAHFPLQQRMNPPQIFTCVSAKALLFSLPSFSCFSAAVVTSSVVEWIT